MTFLRTQQGTRRASGIMSHKGGPGPWMSLTCKSTAPCPAQPRPRATAPQGARPSDQLSHQLDVGTAMASPTFCPQKAEGLLAEAVLQEKEGWRGGPPSTLGG